MTKRSAARRPEYRYLNQFVRSRSSADLIALGLFPNAKEVTESFAAWYATRLFPFDWGDPEVTVVCVGDGKTPRTAATFAFHTAWKTVAVDPLLRHRRIEKHIDRLSVIPDVIENVQVSCRKAVVAAVHSHAPLDVAVGNVHADELSVVAIPCCKRQALPVPPDEEYRDPGILSPENLVKLWKRMEPA